MKPWKSGLVLAAVFALTAAGGVARAQAADTTADLKCFVALSMVNDAADPDVTASIKLGRLYFLGRLDGAAPGMDLKKRFLEVGGKFSVTDIKAELVRCGAILSARAGVLEDIGRSLGAAPPAAHKP
jgi:hypothetical protein